MRVYSQWNDTEEENHVFEETFSKLVHFLPQISHNLTWHGALNILGKILATNNNKSVQFSSPNNNTNHNKVIKKWGNNVMPLQYIRGINGLFMKNIYFYRYRGESESKI
jgi:hypothetical protein